MNFVEAIKSAFSNYANFKGRAIRSEYWWFWLFMFIVNTGLNVATELNDDLVGLLIVCALALALVAPSIAVAVRRLHDVNRSGWWMLLAFTIIGVIPLLYWLIKKGTDGPNRFGEDRLATLSISETTSIVA
jgi:uncharacterized membrane protein YhaH (DUF805 family)